MQPAKPFATNIWSSVNQGESYNKERDGGYLWAPKLDKAGHPKIHWTNMTKVAVDDVIVHYAAGHVRALSCVTDVAQTADKPGELNGNLWQEKDGYLVRAHYNELHPRACHLPACPRTCASRVSGALRR